MSLIIARKLNDQILAISDSLGITFHKNKPNSVIVGNKFLKVYDTILLGYSGVHQLAKKMAEFIKHSLCADYTFSSEMITRIGAYAKGLNDGFLNDNTSFKEEISKETGFVICGYNQGKSIFLLVTPDGSVKQAKKVILLGSLIENIRSSLIKQITIEENHECIISLINHESKHCTKLGINTLHFNLITPKAITKLT